MQAPSLTTRPRSGRATSRLRSSCGGWSGWCRRARCGTSACPTKPATASCASSRCVFLLEGLSCPGGKGPAACWPCGLARARAARLAGVGTCWAPTAWPASRRRQAWAPPAPAPLPHPPPAGGGAAGPAARGQHPELVLTADAGRVRDRPGRGVRSAAVQRGPAGLQPAGGRLAVGQVHRGRAQHREGADAPVPGWVAGRGGGLRCGGVWAAGGGVWWVGWGQPPCLCLWLAGRLVGLACLECRLIGWQRVGRQTGAAQGAV